MRSRKAKPSLPPTIYLIAGCNGAGKTTFATAFLPKVVNCLRFLNADEIARGLWPLNPSAGGLQAGRLLLTQIKDCLTHRETFALESTLSGKTYIRMLREAHKLGYEIQLHYLLLARPAEAIARVRQRVQHGGHSVPEGDIRRRFHRSLSHLVNDYLPLADQWAIWNSRALVPKELAISSLHDIDYVRKLISL